MPAGVRRAVFEQAPEPAPHSAIRSGAPATGARLGRYRLRRPLARKGGLSVWQAVDAGGRERAIKLVELDGASAAVAAALRRERDVLAALDHPGICRVFDWMDCGDRHALVLEYLPGGDLVSLAGGPAGQWLGALAVVAAALGCLHASGFVHRDVKARNVRFDTADRPRLVDFGSSTPIGTRWCAAGTTAEHRKAGWCGREHGPGDDGYAFAALCHEMLHGCPPGVAGPGQRPPRPAGPAAPLAVLVARTLAMTPDECVGSLGEFSAVIEWLSRK